MITLTEHDRLDIVELGSIYACAIDEREPALFDRVFTNDALVTYPRGVGLRGLEQYKRYVHEFHAMHDGTQHFIANHLLTPMEDHVNVRSYAILTIKMLDQPGGDTFHGGAKYTDRVVRTDAGWRIAERHAESMWRGGNLDIIEAGHSAVQHLLSRLE